MQPQELLQFIEQKTTETRPSILLDSQSISEIPPQIGRVKGLQWLDLKNNNIESLPDEVGDLADLVLLDLSNNELQEIPSVIFKLKNLITLDLSGNSIKVIPRDLGCLKKLRYIDLSRNLIESLPEEIGDLRDLEELRVSDNKVQVIPEKIQQANALRLIDLSNNRIEELTPGLSQLEKLQAIVLEGNDITSPPREIVSQGRKAIMAFLRNLQEAMVRRYETKLLLLGEGGVGKSSILRRMRGLEFEPNLLTTLGVDVESLEVRHPNEVDVKIQINIWDFAGQEIEHATHQFFMSPHAVYALAWNSRLGHMQGRLHYWLERIKSHAPDSPILLVATHIDHRQPDINFEAYKREFPQIEEEFSIDNKNDRGIPLFKNAIARHALGLPQMGQLWPLSWRDVERKLKEIDEHHISYNRFKDICMECNIIKIQDIESLSQTLHTLGIILHFKDDRSLRDLVVLKPNWITKAISYALTDINTKDRQGILNHSNLPKIWKDYDPSLYPAFFSLMNKFELCYQVENNNNQSLIPALLPYKPPHYESFPSSVEMVFRLSSVPAGLMSRFIVRTHRFSTRIHWREGAVLEYDGQRAKAELLENKREFQLSVFGSSPIHFFSVLVDTVNQILNNYPGLNIERLVPCTCSKNEDPFDSCGHYFEYEELVRYFKKGNQIIVCGKTIEEVNVVSLLYGIHESSMKRVLSEVSSLRDDIIQMDRIDPLSEKERQVVLLGQRSVIQDFNRLESVDTQCPSIFFLSKRNEIETQLNLICQCSEGWHLASSNSPYIFAEEKSTLLSLSPIISEILPLLEYVVPLPGIDINLKSDFSEKLRRARLSTVNYMGEMAQFEPNSSGRVEGLKQALQRIYFILDKIDPEHDYCGLKMTTTPDGYRVWLCPYHYAQLQPSPLLNMNKKFDVFLCHNSLDKDFVRELGRVLASSGIKCWIDEDEILGGDSWQDAMAKGLRESACTLVCMGPNKWGSWQYEELQVALAQAVDKEDNHNVIPLLIPPLSNIPENASAFLKNRHCLRISSLDNEMEMTRLLKSIKR